EGKDYEYTADDEDDLGDVLNALEAAIEADADGEGGHGLSVAVTAVPGEGDGEYKLTITGKEDGTSFTVGGVTVTKVADVEGALDDDPVHNDYYPIAPAAQVSTVTFEDVPPGAGYVYFILIDGRLYSVTADGEEDLAAVLTELKEEILEDVDGEDGHGLSVALLPADGENG